MLRKCPGDGVGANPGTSGTSRPDLCVTPHTLDRMSAGQTGHFHGTNGTRLRDGCSPGVGVSRRISSCLLVFFSSLQMEGLRIDGGNPRSPLEKMHPNLRYISQGTLSGWPRN